MQAQPLADSTSMGAPLSDGGRFNLIHWRDMPSGEMPSPMESSRPGSLPSMITDATCPIFGSLSASSTMDSSQFCDATASLFMSAMYLPFALANPALFPPAKPRFSSNRM